MSEIGNLPRVESGEEWLVPATALFAEDVQRAVRERHRRVAPL